MSRRVKNEIEVDHNHDGIDRRGFLKCMTWSALPLWRLPIECLGVALILLTGHLGGFLSGVNP